MTVVLKDVRDGATVEYEVVSKRKSLGDVVAGESFGFDVTSLSAENTTLGQELTLVGIGWDIESTDRGLTGDVTFEVRGGTVEYSGVGSYEETLWGEWDLSCLAE